MQAIFAAVVSRLTALENLQNSGADDVFVVTQQLWESNPRKIASFQGVLIGNHQTIHVTSINSLFSHLSGKLSDITFEIEQFHNAASLANQMIDCELYNVRISVIYRLTNLQSYKVVNYVERSHFDLFKCQTNQQEKTQFALSCDSSSFNFSIMLTQLASIVRNSAICNSFVFLQPPSSDIDAATRNASSQVYCATALSGFCVVGGNKELQRDENGEFELYTRINQSQSFKVFFTQQLCQSGLSSQQKCIQDECGLLNIPCSGRGRCIDFKCQCDSPYTQQTQCRDEGNVNTSTGSLVAGWTLSVIAIIGIALLITFWVVRKRGKRASPEKDISVAPASCKGEEEALTQPEEETAEN